MCVCECVCTPGHIYTYSFTDQNHRTYYWEKKNKRNDRAERRQQTLMLQGGRGGVFSLNAFKHFENILDLKILRSF